MPELLRTMLIIAAAAWGGPMLICAIPFIRAIRSERRAVGRKIDAPEATKDYRTYP